MTTTITAESRAKKLVKELSGASRVWVCSHHHVVDIIAAAIRDAEDAAYERAAQEVRTQIGQWTGGPLRIEAAVLALKSPSPKDQGHE